MESESQGECSPASSRILVEKFVTRVWEHPLLDERTRRLRKNALETIVAMLSSQGIKKDSYFAMLAGSLMWVPEKEETSIDFDFIMVAKDSETLEKIKQFCFGFPKYEIAHSLKIHVLRTVSEADLTESRSDSIFPELAPLFLTPDDYIAGNVQAARAARLKAMTFFKDQRRDPQGAWGLMMNIFQRYYRDWEKDSSGFEPHKGIKDPTEARSKRLSEQLERRAKQVRKPEYASRYEETFLKAKDKMQPPDFDTYFQAMVSSQGYLGIRPQYRAKGIK